MTVPGGSAARSQAQPQSQPQPQSQSQAVQRRRKSTSVSLLLGGLALVCLAVLCSEDPDLLSIGRRSLASKRKWASGVYFERTGSNERQQENVLALSTRSSEEAVIKVMSGANELYMDRVLALADRVKLFGTTVSIVPFNWIPPPSLAGTEEKKKKRKKSKTKTKTYVFEEPIADEILPAKLAAISRAVDDAPLHSQVLWIDADTLILNDVTAIARRSAANGCDMSIHRRAGNCATDSGWKIPRKKYAAGIISVTVSDETRAYFKDVYHLSKTDPSCRQWKRNKNMYWYQDQLALLKAFERAPNDIVLCDLNEDEMHIARPHDCGSLKGVSNSTITFSGKKTPTVLRLELALLHGKKQSQ